MIEVASLAFRMLAILLIRAPMNESYEGITLLLWGLGYHAGAIFRHSPVMTHVDTEQC
jgi:hypothetical protein